MKISEKIVKRFQEGGQVDVAAEETASADAAAAGAAPQGTEQDPIMQLAELANQALQTQDCQAALAVAEAFLGLIQGGAPAEGGAAPAPAPTEGAPVFKKGGVLVRRVKV